MANEKAKEEREKKNKKEEVDAQAKAEMERREAIAQFNVSNMGKYWIDKDRIPTDDEIADEIGISPKRVARVREMSMASVPSGQLDEVAGEDGDSSIAPAVSTPSPVPFAQDAVYMSLDKTDRFIFDALTGSHGSAQLPAKTVAERLGITPAAVSQRASRIAQQIVGIANG